MLIKYYINSRSVGVRWCPLVSVGVRWCLLGRVGAEDRLKYRRYLAQDLLPKYRTDIFEILGGILKVIVQV